MKNLPTQAQVVIIGGGIVGCSVAYHLAKFGWKDVVLLERKTLTSGTTWAAAGLCGQLWGSRELTKLANYGHALYETLEEETGQPTNFVRCGSLRVARSKALKQEYDRLMGIAKSFGLEMQEISFKEAKDLWPLLSTEGLEAVYYQPNDGMTNPIDTGQALAKGARMNGAQVFEETAVTGIDVKDGAVCGVKTNRGDIACEYVVNAAGMWARALGEMVGVSLPLFAAEHMHAITQPIEGIFRGMPILRDMDGRVYFRQEVGGILFGGFEPVAKPWGMNGIPENFQFTELNEDWDQFEVFVEAAIQRIPALETAEIRHLSVVPESFTRDNLYILGPAPEVKNFWVACGMNSVGISSAGGVGMALAQWMDQGYTEDDLWPVDVRRFSGWMRNKRYLAEVVSESVGTVFAKHWPFKQPTTARPALKSPFHDRLVELGACHGVASGWERPNWFAREGQKAEYEYSWGRQNWFVNWAEEHMAVRDNVGLYDLTSMGKLRMEGADASEVLQNICANDVDVEKGKVVYTTLLNERGGIEADLTVTRLERDVFYIVTSAANRNRDYSYIKSLVPGDAGAVLTDVTDSYAVLALMGPKSRDLLAEIVTGDISKQAFPFATAREIDLAYGISLALRISFSGELGYEIHIPTSMAMEAFEAIYEAGRKYGLKMVGLTAVDSLRLEKGYRHWGSDIGPDDTPLEAGLGFGVRLDKGEFIGREALLRQKEEGLRRKLVIFTLDDGEPLLYHDEPIYRNGELVSINTHGSYAHLLGRSIGMGYLEREEGITNDWILEGRYEIEVERVRVPATVHIKPPYDPANKSLKR